METHKRTLGPAWTRNEIEKPQGEKDMGTWIGLYYTEEQQCRLGVDEEGNKLSLEEKIKIIVEKIHKKILKKIKNRENMEEIKNEIIELKGLTRDIEINIDIDETIKYTQIINKSKLVVLTNTTTDKMNELNINFDFTIIGGGPSGIMCAYRLSKLNPKKRILILEKNINTYDDYKNSQYNELKNWLMATADPRFTKAYNSESVGNNDDIVEIRLGEGIGGGTLHFGLQYIDQLDVLKKSSYEFTMTEFQDALNKVNEICNTKSYDVNSDDYPMVLKNLYDNLVDHSGNNYLVYNNKIYSRDLQTRFSLAELLESRDNITIWQEKNVKNVMLNELELMETGETSVNRIIFFEPDNKLSGYNFNTEVVLCAGAIGTPCILQRSMIGPSDLNVYRTNDLIPIIELPVGKKLYDHTGYSVQYFHRDYLPPSLIMNSEGDSVDVIPRKKIVLDQKFLNEVNKYFPNIFIAIGNNIPDDDKNLIWDFSNWSTQHPGGNAAIKQWSSKNYQLQYPHDYARWFTFKSNFIKIGEFNSIIDFDDLPEYLKKDDNIITLFNEEVFTIYRFSRNMDIITNIGDISSSMLGHIQTRDAYNRWQTYYSLIPDYSKPNNLLPLLILTHATSGRINNNGTVYIKDLDDTAPKVNYNYSYDTNIDNILNSLLTNHNVIQSGTGDGEYILNDISLSQFIVDNSLNEMRDYIKKEITSIYHYHGTCGINSVVNYGQKVIKTNNLSIGDISVLTSPIAGSTSVSAMVCGYRCAECLSSTSIVEKEREIVGVPLTRTVDIHNNDDSGFDISYQEDGNNIIFTLNSEKKIGIYSETNDIRLINNTITIDSNLFDEELIFYIWEKLPVENKRNIKSDKCEIKKRKEKNLFRSFAGVRYITTQEHRLLPTLVRSILGRSVWKSTTLYYILTTSFGEWTDNEKNLIEHAMQQYANVSKLIFIETTNWNLADIEWKRLNVNPIDDTIVGAAYSPSLYGSLIEIYAGAYQSNKRGSSYPKGGAVGSWDYATFLHELGHALGLMHPHDSSEGSTTMPNVVMNDWGEYISNNKANAFPFTIMTYNDIGSRFTPEFTYEYGYLSSLGIVDIAAIQAIYGINADYNSGNDIYKLISLNKSAYDPVAKGVGTGWVNISDTGGIDTITASDSTTDALIDLRPSDVNNSDGEYLYVSRVENIYGGFTISENVNIENAIGGDNDDIIFENSKNNEIDGGEGNDTVYFLKASTDYLLIKHSSGNIEVINVNNNNNTKPEKNILKNIEYIIYQNNVIINTSDDITNNYILPETNNGVKITITKQ
jgi:hypothetical protein